MRTMLLILDDLTLVIIITILNLKKKVLFRQLKHYKTER
jgi:hypothetical protein